MRIRGTFQTLSVAVPLLVTLLVATVGSTDARSKRSTPRSGVGTTIFQSGFESGRFSDWSSVRLAGDGTASVQSSIVATGSLAAELSETSHRGSRAALRKTFSARYPDLAASGRFRVISQGSARLPLLRFFDARWHQVATVFRQNGAIRVSYARRKAWTRGRLPLNRWRSIALRVTAIGPSSMVEVRLNGRLIYHTNRAWLDRAGVTTVQVGNNEPGQAFSLAADSIQVQRFARGLPSLPVNIGPPAVTGLRVSGRSLSAGAGTWRGQGPISHRYRWLRCGAGGGHCRPIAHATGRTYVARAADVGRTLRVSVTAANSIGRATATSTATTPVQALPASRALPSILGTAQDGEMVTANGGSWGGTAPIAYVYQWLRCDAAGAGCHPIATGARYMIGSGDVGGTLRLKVTATNPAGSATATSPAVRIAAAPPASKALPTILGTPQDGQTLHADPGAWSGTPSISYAYQWLRCDPGTASCTPITGATHATYTVITADVGSDLRVNVTASNSVGFATARSAGVHAAASLPLNSAPPTIGGTAQDGQTVTVDPGTWGGTPPISYTYQWLRCAPDGTGCQSIPGETDTSYTVVSADVGGTLRVDVTATNPGGSATARTSAVVAVAAPPANQRLPTITGTPQAGQTLTANKGSWTGTPTINYTYQWLRCDSGGANCSSIPGATNLSYIVAGGDVGSTLAVTVTGTNSAGSATATSNPTAQVQPSSSPAPVALWHMDETSGSTMFDSAGAHNGTLSHVQLGLAGVSGKAYGFDGHSSYVSVPSTDDLNPYAADVTVTIHLKTTGTPPAPPADWDLIRKGLYDTDPSEFKMEFQQSGKASCGFKGTGGYSELIAGPAINDGQWHTIQCVKTSSAIKVIVDGTTFSQAANLGSISNTNQVVIGAHPGSDWYNGSLDEASIEIG